MNMQYEPLTVDRAQAIVEHAEKEYATGGRFDNTFTPFEAGGASSPLEALQSLYIVIAQRFSFVSQSGSSAAVKTFEEYVAYSRSISMDLFVESTAIESTSGSVTPKTIAMLARIDSFVSFLRTLRPSSPDYWPQVYERLGLAWPVASDSKQVGTSIEKKPWWRFW